MPQPKPQLGNFDRTRNAVAYPADDIVGGQDFMDAVSGTSYSGGNAGPAVALPGFSWSGSNNFGNFWQSSGVSETPGGADAFHGRVLNVIGDSPIYEQASGTSFGFGAAGWTRALAGAASFEIIVQYDDPTLQCEPETWGGNFGGAVNGRFLELTDTTVALAGGTVSTTRVPGAYSHIHVVDDGTDVELFVDGASIGTIPSVGVTATGVTYLGAGTFGGVGNHRRSMWHMYDIALSPTQVTALVGEPYAVAGAVLGASGPTVDHASGPATRLVPGAQTLTVPAAPVVALQSGPTSRLIAGVQTLTTPAAPTVSAQAGPVARLVGGAQTAASAAGPTVATQQGPTARLLGGLQTLSVPAAPTVATQVGPTTRLAGGAQTAAAQSGATVTGQVGPISRLTAGLQTLTVPTAPSITQAPGPTARLSAGSQTADVGLVSVPQAEGPRLRLVPGLQTAAVPSGPSVTPADGPRLRLLPPAPQTLTVPAPPVVPAQAGPEIRLIPGVQTFPTSLDLAVHVEVTARGDTLRVSVTVDGLRTNVMGDALTLGRIAS